MWSNIRAAPNAALSVPVAAPQSVQLYLASDINQGSHREQEGVWKQVEELQEQNRLLRQRNFELEVRPLVLHWVWQADALY